MAYIESPALTGYRLDHVRLRELRLRVPLTLAELARKSGLSYHSLHNMERGKQTPRIQTLRALADALRCDPSELMVIDSSLGAEAVEGDDEQRSAV